ncbi:MAG: hypothetical protein MJ211_06720 [Bacteroidales bacterium]|nr:hypothetical protein [Bacteroidales bacterium]
MATYLDLFLTEQNRIIEEEFCKTFSEKYDLSLSFIHNNEAFTDGEIIVCDPQFGELYINEDALINIENYLKIPHKLSRNQWLALKVVTRFQTIHECLHILYTDFSIDFSKYPKCKNSKNKISALASISNIIEDAYIEAVGVSVYDNIEFYLRFGRVSQQFIPKYGDDIIEEYYFKINPSIKPYFEYKKYMILYVLYPFMTLPKVCSEAQKYIDFTKDLFTKATIQPTPELRYEYSKQIFDIILPIIPDDEKYDISDEKSFELFDKHTHNQYSDTKKSVKSQEVTRKLFSKLNGEKLDNENQINEKNLEILSLDILDFENEETKSWNNIESEDEVEYLYGDNFDISPFHGDIKIVVTKYGSNLNLKNGYNEIVKSNKSIINNYKSKISYIMQAQVDIREEKQIIGNGINSKNLAEHKKRFWYKINKGIDIPEISVLFLLDGSGSMLGERNRAVIETSIILHEVLYFQNIEHCFIEHRAIGLEPQIEINILKGLNDDEKFKYNLLKNNASDCNRDSLALVWAEKYLQENANCDHKIIIVLSDGIPYHPYDNYVPPISVQDLTNTVKKIEKRGIHIFAIALDNNDEKFETYHVLKEIYPQTISCTNLKTLPSKLFRIISKELENN